jgi:peptidyl-prolyl cis-trans isomerase-like 4
MTGDPDDPFPDPANLKIPEAVPTKPPDGESGAVRIAEDEDPLATLPEEEAERERRKAAAAASALTLEMVGDLPFANVRPPENVLFVCKLNSVTRDEDLDLIFSRFGKIMSCQVIREKRTGDSLQYAFIEFDKREDAEQVCYVLQLSTFLTGTPIGIFQDAERVDRRSSDMGGLVGTSNSGTFMTLNEYHIAPNQWRD